MTTKHEQLLRLQTSAEENQNKEISSNNPKELLHREKIEGSPLWIVGTEEHGYFVSMGKHRLTESQPTISKARELLTYEQWNIIANMIVQIVNSMDEMKTRPTVNDMFKNGIEVNK